MDTWVSLKQKMYTLPLHITFIFHDLILLLNHPLSDLNISWIWSTLHKYFVLQLSYSWNRSHVWPMHACGLHIWTLKEKNNKFYISGIKAKWIRNLNKQTNMLHNIGSQLPKPSPGYAGVSLSLAKTELNAFWVT